MRAKRSRMIRDHICEETQTVVEFAFYWITIAEQKMPRAHSEGDSGLRRSGLCEATFASMNTTKEMAKLWKIMNQKSISQDLPGNR